MKLEDLGYDSFFESYRKKIKDSDTPIARVTSEHKGSYRVLNEHGSFVARVSGKQMFTSLSKEDYPAVGDWVHISEHDNHQAVIHSIFPRKTLLKRQYNEGDDTQIIAANIDVAFLIESADRDYNLNRFERYMSIAKDEGISPMIVLNKIDLLSDSELNIKQSQMKERFPSTEIILTSTFEEGRLHTLRRAIQKRKTYCLLGSSGVGKSTLINKLLTEEIIPTGEIGTHSRRGKHTTVKRAMYFLQGGGIVIDNPGMREIGVTDIDNGIHDVFDVIEKIARNCKFNDCTHEHEPKCAVRLAIQNGTISNDQYLNYRKIKKEARYYEMTKHEKRKKDRKFGKYVKKVMEQKKHLDF